MMVGKSIGSFIRTVVWLTMFTVTGSGLQAHAEPVVLNLDRITTERSRDSVSRQLKTTNRQTISIIKAGEGIPGLSTSGSDIRAFFRLRVDRLVTEARIRLCTTGDKRGAVDIEVVINDYTAGQIEMTAGKDEILALDPALFSNDNALVLRRAGADPCDPTGGEELLLALKTTELEIEQAVLPIANDIALLPLPFFDPRVEEPITIQVALLGERTLEMFRAAGLVAAYFGLQGGSRLRFAVFFNELPDGHTVVLASGESELIRGFITSEGGTVRLVDHPNSTDNTAKLFVIAAEGSDELFAVAKQFAAGKIARGGVLPGNRNEYKPYEAPRWVKNGEAVRLDDLTNGTDLILEGTSRTTQAVSFRLAPDLFAELNQSIPLIVNYRINLPPGAPPPELMVELNHRIIGKLAVPKPSQRHKQQRTSFDIHPSQLSGYNELRVHADFSPDGKGCRLSGSDLPSVTIEGSTILHTEKLHHFSILPDVKLFVYDGFPFTRFADLRETAILLAPQPRPAELSLLFSALAHVSAVTGELPRRAVFTNSSSTYEELGRDRDLLIVASSPSHPWLQNHTKRLPFAYTGSGLIPRRPWSPGVLLNYLTGAAAFAQLSRAYRFTENVLPVLGIAGMGSPWTSGRSTIILLATENNQIPALVDAMGYAEASLAGGDLLLAGATRRGAFVLGPRTISGELPLWRKGRWFLATHWLLLLPMLVLPSLFLVRLSARALELLAQKRLQLPRKKQS